MLNPFVIKKYVALTLVGFLSVILYVLGRTYYGFLWGIAWFFIGLLLSVVVANLLLRNPFTIMLEGKGILTFSLDSTGIIRPFIVTLKPPYMKGGSGGSVIEDVFDRQAVFSLATPRDAPNTAEYDEDKKILTIKLDDDKLNKARFGFFHYPVIIWNEQIKSVLTKDFLAERETGAFAEHGVLYMNRKMEELTSHVRDFARHIVELMRPQKSSVFKNWLIYLVIFVVVVIVLILAWPFLAQAFGGATAGAVKAVNTATSGGATIVPR